MTMTTTPSPPRARSADPRRAGQRTRAAGALLVLLLLLVGLPTLLAAVIGNPLPQHVPSGLELHRALTSPLSDNTVVRILATVAWLAWAHLLFSVIREFAAQLRGRPGPRRL